MAPPKLHPLVRQARAAVAAGNLQSAVRLAEQRLADAPRDLNARLVLVDVRLAAGLADEAIAEMREALRRIPDNPLAHVKLAHMLAGEARWSEALDEADRALKLDAGCTPAVAVKCLVFERQGKDPKAERLLKAQLAAERPHVDVGPVLVRLLVRAGRLEEAIDFAARYAAAHPAPTRSLREVRASLACAHEHAGDLDAAFAAATEANATAPAPFDAGVQASRIEQHRAATARTTMDALPRATVPPDAPPVVFIVGMPRTGATVIERILHAHPEATGIGDAPVIHRIAYGLHARMDGTAPYPDCLDTLTADVVEAARADALTAMRKASGRGRVLVSRSLGTVLHLGLVALLVPEARVIHARRDPMDVGLSCWASPLGTPGTAWANRLEDVAWYQGQVAGLMDHWREVTDLPILDVAYEDLVREQRATTERILEHVGLPWHDACLAPEAVKRVETSHDADRLRQPLDDASIGRAARWGDRLAPLRAALDEVAS